MTSVSTIFLVAFLAVTALGLVVVELGPEVTMAANTVDQVITGQASTSTDDGVPNLVIFAGRVADSVVLFVDCSGGTHSAAVTDQIVTFSAETFSIDVSFIRVAFGGAEAKVLHESGITDTGFGGGIVGRVDNTSTTGSVGHLIELRETNASFSADVEDLVVVTRNTAESESLVVDLIPGAGSANSLDGVVSGFAAAFSVLEDFVDSASNNTVSSSIESVSSRTFAGLALRVIFGVSFALSADVVDSEMVFGAVALFLDDIIDFKSRAGDSADSEVGVIELSSSALLADTLDLVVR